MAWLGTEIWKLQLRDFWIQPKLPASQIALYLIQYSIWHYQQY
ncbi:MAG: hypothetical protein UT38_C0010G0028 [Microgenomates group bacterium GW2011_GWA2_39_19]|nr:MAG: hypothetical protein UT38_C0010G0028 [Microgenomates group bacterium GW2011_GWA2_39_19]